MLSRENKLSQKGIYLDPETFWVQKFRHFQENEFMMLVRVWNTAVALGFL